MSHPNTATSRNSFYWIACEYYRVSDGSEKGNGQSAERACIRVPLQQEAWPMLSVWGWLQLQSSISLWEVTGELHLRLHLPLRSMWTDCEWGFVCCSTYVHVLMPCMYVNAGSFRRWLNRKYVIDAGNQWFNMRIKYIYKLYTELHILAKLSRWNRYGRPG